MTDKRNDAYLIIPHLTYSFHWICVSKHGACLYAVMTCQLKIVTENKNVAKCKARLLEIFMCVHSW